MRKTKIVCTLGPSTDDPQVMRELMLAGMNVARFNFSHGTHEDHLDRLKLVKRLRAELGLPIATMLDTKGPEVRIGLFENGSITLKEGDKFTLTTDEIMGNQERCTVKYANFPKDVNVGTRVLFSDGTIEMIVDEIDGNEVHLTVQNNGKLSNNKSINLPEVKLSLPFVSDRDREDIIFGIENDFDFIALSFTRCKEDVLEVKKILDQYNCHSMRIIAKLENAEGVEKIDEILEVVDAVMVARGDMGVEIDFTEIPKIQKDLIRKCYNSGKPAITATQMLESMTEHPRPTRAEVSDVANAIYDGTTATMLSGETAAGKYPIEAVKAMSRIAEYTENQINYQDRYLKNNLNLEEDVVNTIVSASVEASFFLKAKAIVVATVTGFTALTASYYRPSVPIIASCTDEKATRQLKLGYGIYPYYAQLTNDLDVMKQQALEIAEKSKIAEKDDLVVLVCGSLAGGQMSTDTMIITKA